MNLKGKARGKGDRTTALLATAAALLLVLGLAGTSHAALGYFSENYTGQIGMGDIGVTLLENGEPVSHRDYAGGTWSEGQGELLLDMAADGQNLQPGKRYEEELSVRNSGDIDQYVKLVVRRYWEDGQGGKRTDLSPGLIRLGLLTDGSGWVEDEAASTPERTVLYYTKALAAGDESAPVSDQLRIDPSVLGEVRTEWSEDEAATAHDYDGARFVLEAEAFAVQTHNAEQAIKSAWGVDVDVHADGSLSLAGSEGGDES